MNLQVIQFQYGLEFSQTLVFLICTFLPRCHPIGFSSLIIEFRPISNRIPEFIISKTNSEKVGIVFDRIIGSSDPEVLADQASDLFSSEKAIFFLGFFVLPH